MNSIPTKKGLVVKVDEGGATILIDGRKQHVPWGTLRAAARQEDPELRAAYQPLLAEAEAAGAGGPVEVEVCQDHTNVNWVVRVRSVWGRHPATLRWMADEGGTHLRHHLAAAEARDICQRLGKRVVRYIGF